MAHSISPHVLLANTSPILQGLFANIGFMCSGKVSEFAEHLIYLGHNKLKHLKKFISEGCSSGRSNPEKAFALGLLVVAKLL